MTTIIALSGLLPILIIALSGLALLGIYASYKLATLSDHLANRSFRVILASTVLVPFLAYQANNYWVSIHSTTEKLALHAIPMNHNHLEFMYFIWWCIMSALACMLYVWRKRHAA